MAFKIEVDKEACIGCGSCTANCDNFEMKDGKAHPVKSTMDEIDCSKDAEDICPVDAIKVTEE